MFSCIVIESSFDPGERLQALGSLWFAHVTEGNWTHNISWRPPSVVISFWHLCFNLNLAEIACIYWLAPFKNFPPSKMAVITQKYIVFLKMAIKDLVIKRQLKQWWSTIPPILTKQTITSHLKSLNKKRPWHGIRNPGPGLGQAHNCEWWKPINGILFDA